MRSNTAGSDAAQPVEIARGLLADRRSLFRQHKLCCSSCLSVSSPKPGMLWGQLGRWVLLSSEGESFSYAAV